MREILFRGKRIDNGEWVKGSFLLDGLAHRSLDKEHIPFSKCYIVPETDRENIRTEFNDGSYFLDVIGYHVITETVGQYTGLTDKTGKKIFEGDIVRTYRNEETFDLMMVEWYEDSAGFVLATQKHFCYYESLTNSHIYLEVIANIHDNPEFLEVPHE